MNVPTKQQPSGARKVLVPAPNWLSQLAWAVNAEPLARRELIVTGLPRVDG
jgi:hypothetical protein